MRKSAIRIVAFICILCIILCGINRVFKFKYGDGIYGLTKLYEQDRNSIDVLLLGSSHAFEAFNTGVLWDEQGIAAYTLSGSTQPLWSTYYYLKEALKTQKPQLIVLEAFMVTEDYIDDYIIIKNNFGLKWSLDKLNSIRTSVPDERLSEFLLEYSQYHMRYKELSAADFMPDQNDKLYEDWKGFGCNMLITPLESMDVSHVEERKPIPDKNEEYYRKVIELAKENDIPIAVVVSPYAEINEEHQAMYNTAADIASEYDVPFKNFNLYLDEMGIDFSTDAADAAHLNYKGNQKYTSYFGEYLKDNFDITDRRGDSRYASWQRGADYFRQLVYDQDMRGNSDINAMLGMLDNDAYRIMISVDGACNTSDENIRDLINNLGITEEGVKGLWLKENGEIIWSSGMCDAEKYITTQTHDFALRRVEATDSNYITVNNVTYEKPANGITVVMFDTVTGKMADRFSIDMDQGYSLVR